MKYFKMGLLICFLFILTACNIPLESSISETVSQDSDKMIIHFLDVGQGDSTFIEFPNKETMLIDAGEKEYGEVVLKYIRKLGYKTIDYLVGTHPHTDHIGGLEKIVESMSIQNVYMPKALATSNTYENLLKAIQEKGLSIHTTKAGMNLLSSDDLSVDVVAPNNTEYSSLNNYSIVLKIRYKNRTFLFTGDAEKVSEEEILKAGYDVSSDVIKVGHHGSDTSSSLAFLKKVQPKYAIISVGKGNSYHHPSDSILERYQSLGAKVYRTDEAGNILLVSDGEGIQITNEKSEVLVDEVPEENESIQNEDISIQLLSLSPIVRGENATIEILGEANTSYSIQVFYKSGVSTAKGLEDKVSDAEGKVSWTWKVSSSVDAGKYQIILKKTGDTLQKVIDYEIP